MDDVIKIHGLELDCIVGLRPHERVRAQRLRLDISLGTDTREAGRSGRIATTLDYDRIAEDSVALLKFRRYQLIEGAAEELAAMLLGAYPSARWVELRLEKPGALEGRAAAASIEIRRTRGDLYASQSETQEQRGDPSAPDERELLLRTREAALWLLTIRDGCALPESDEAARTIDRIISGQLCSDDGRAWAAGLAQPEAEQPLRWRASGATARVFRCEVGKV